MNGILGRILSLRMGQIGPDRGFNRSKIRPLPFNECTHPKVDIHKGCKSGSLNEKKISPTFPVKFVYA